MRLVLTAIAAATGIITAVGLAAPAEAQPYRHGGYHHHRDARPYHHGGYHDRYWRNHHRGYDRHHHRGYYGRHG